MKPYGTMVIKPDAINPHDLKIITNILTKYGLQNPLMFKIPNYTKLMKDYRIADIQFKECENAEQEIEDEIKKLEEMLEEKRNRRKKQEAEM